MKLIGFLPYILILICAVFSSYFAKKNKGILYLFTIYLSIFTSFSGTVSPDRERYALDYINKNYVYEPMFTFISNILHLLNLNEYYLFFVFSFFTFLFTILTINRIEKIFNTNYYFIFFSYLFYIVMPGMYFGQFITIRQCLAISIMSYAILLYLTNIKYKKIVAIILFIVGFITHYSSILYFIIFIFIAKILKNQLSNLIYYSLFILSLLTIIFPLFKNIVINIMLYLFNNNKYFTKYIYYVLVTSEFNLNDTISIIIKNTFFILIIFLQLIYKIHLKNEKEKNIYNILFNLSFIGLLLRNVLAFNPSFMRITNYFTFFSFITFSLWISKNICTITVKNINDIIIKQKLIEKYFIIYFVFILIIFLYFYNIFLFVGETNSRIFYEHGLAIINKIIN